MLKYGEVNPLNVAGLREIDHCPPHFQRVEFTLATGNKQIKDWIYENLNGRFWIGHAYNQEAGIQMYTCVAFEISSEASYFALMLDKINSTNLILW